MSPDRSGALGALVLVAASLLFGVMAVLAKEASAYSTGAQLALVRFLVGVAATGAYHVGVQRLRVVNLRALALRGTFGGFAVLGYFLAIEHMPVGVATLLQYTSPVFTALFAALFLRERLDGATVVGLGVATAGVALVLRADAHGAIGFGRWELVGIAAAVCSGAAVTAMRWARRTDGSWEVFGAFCTVGAVVTAMPATGGWLPLGRAGWAWLVAVGLVAVAAQILYTWALRYTRAATAGVISQLTPASALAMGALLLGEPLGARAAVGAGVTLVGVTLAAWPRPTPPAA